MLNNFRAIVENTFQELLDSLFGAGYLAADTVLCLVLGKFYVMHFYRRELQCFDSFLLLPLPLTHSLIPRKTMSYV
uniref:Uncharacterized protein n=1 Tax=Salix viminalis TaxID=40686 RepID=A0A6N2KWF9_SALVM